MRLRPRNTLGTSPTPDVGEQLGAYARTHVVEHGPSAHPPLTPPTRLESGPTGQQRRSSTAQVAAAGAWGLAGRSLLLVANFLAMPFVIRLLGAAGYGVWALLQTVATWGLLSGIGMASSTTKLGSECFARHDDAGEAEVVWTALALAAASTLTVATCVALVAPQLMSGALDVPHRLVSDATTALRVACVVLVLQVMTGVLSTPLEVRLRWRPYTIANVGTNLAGTIAMPAALLLFAGGVVTTSVVNLASAACLVVALAVLGLRYQPAIRRPSISRRTTKALLSYGGPLALGNLAAVPLTSAERLFLGANHPATVVAYYAVAVTLATTLQVVPQQLIPPLLPALTRLAEVGRDDEHRSLYSNSLSGIYLTVTPLTVLLAFIGRPFLSVWAGHAYGANSFGPLLIVLVGVWANAIAWVPTYYLLSSGRTRLLAALQLAELGPFLLAAWALTSHFGALGAALALGGRYVVDALALSVAARRTGRLPLFPSFRRRGTALGAPWLLVPIAVVGALATRGLAARGLLAFLLAGAYCAFVWRAALVPAERATLRTVLAQLRHRPQAAATVPSR